MKRHATLSVLSVENWTQKMRVDKIVKMYTLGKKQLISKKSKKKLASVRVSERI